MVAERLAHLVQQRHIYASDAPSLNDLDLEAAVTFGGIAGALGVSFGRGRCIVAYRDDSQGAANGMQLGDYAMVNVSCGNAMGAAHTTWHELKYIIDCVAERETKAVLKGTPPQRFMARIGGQLDEMSEEGMGACAELLLYKGELDAIGDETPREVRLQELLKWQYLRSEITADSMSNRADDEGFLDKLRDADPKGFGASGKR